MIPRMAKEVPGESLIKFAKLVPQLSELVKNSPLKPSLEFFCQEWSSNKFIKYKNGPWRKNAEIPVWSLKFAGNTNYTIHP